MNDKIKDCIENILWGDMAGDMIANNYGWALMALMDVFGGGQIQYRMLMLKKE